MTGSKRPSDAPRPTKEHHVPPATGKVGMLLFLAGLTMLFGASMVGYLIVRVQSPTAPPLGEVELPAGLWFSTLILVALSVVLHDAVKSVRRERQRRFRLGLVAALVLAGGFLAVQAPSLGALLNEHMRQLDDVPDGHVTALYGLIFTLIVVHAMHVVGGLIPLAWVTVAAVAGRYDHENHQAIGYTAMYWHFLDGVWLMMFLVLLITR